MKKYIAGMLVAAAALVASAAPSWAFQSVQITTITAQTTTGGAKTAAFSDYKASWYGLARYHRKKGAPA